MFEKILNKLKGTKLRMDQEKNYPSFRRKLKTGDLVAWEGVTSTSIFDGLFARLIRLVTRHNIHHVGKVYITPHRAFVVEAIPPFIRLVPLSRRGNFYHIPMEMVQDEKLLYRLERDIGTVYSIPDAVRSYIAGDVSHTNGMQCVEHCKLIDVERGIPVPTTYLPGAFVDYMARERTVTHVIH